MAETQEKRERPISFSIPAKIGEFRQMPQTVEGLEPADFFIDPEFEDQNEGESDDD